MTRAVNSRLLRGRFTGWMRSAYLRTREFIGYFLVVVTVVGGLSPNPKLQVGALGMLLAMILNLLFEIYSRTDSSSLPLRRVKSVADARAEMERFLKTALKEEGFIRVQWIGMTMFNVWNTMEAVFDSLAVEARAPRVQFEVAMLDSSWLNQNRINPAWTGVSADFIAEKIRLYAQGNLDKLRGLNWAFEVHRYAHMPTLHGGLINGKYLFLGICRWEGRTLKAGDRPYDVYTFKDGDDALDKIKVFDNWFNLCFGPKPEWYLQLAGEVAIEPELANTALNPTATEKISAKEAEREVLSDQSKLSRGT